MRISVIGCGYLGAVHAACMAALGHDVVGIDVDARKVEALAAARRRSTSPGCPSCSREPGATGRLRFTTDIADGRGLPTSTSSASAPRRSTAASMPPT